MNKYLQLIRIHHWIKNLFVFIGVFFAGLVFTPPHLLNALLVFISFCLATSAVYIINDIKDREYDKLHKKKKTRPLASGAITIKTAKNTLAIFLILLSGSLFFIKPLAIAFVLAYVILNVIYTFVLKKIVIIDVFSIALSFILRVLAGTIGIGILASSWLLVTIISLSLFLGFGKRFNEKKFVEGHRKVLQDYTEGFITHLILITSTLSIAFYSLYIIETNPDVIHILTIPLVMYGFFRYIYITHILKGGGDPTEELLTDKPLLLTVILWAILLFIGTNL